MALLPSTPRVHLWPVATSLTWLVGIAGLAVTIIYAPATQIDARYLIVTIILALMLIITLAHAVAFFHDAANRQQLSSLVTVMEVAHPKKTVLILNPSPLFAFDSMVAIYRSEHKVEQLLATGIIETIQTNGLVQVHVVAFIEPETSEAWIHLKQKNQQEISKIIVKPYVPSRYLNLVAAHE
jgi:hypothetical protein